MDKTDVRKLIQSFIKVKTDHIYLTSFGNRSVSQSQEISMMQLPKFRTGRNSEISLDALNLGSAKRQGKCRICQWSCC